MLRHKITKLPSSILVFLIALMGFVCPAQSETVLPKEDAAVMFEMTFVEWKRNVLAAEQAGFAKSDSSRPLELMMITDVPNGRVITIPSYESEDALPWKLSVAVLLNPAASEIFSTKQDADYKRFIEEIYEEMRPLYTVLTSLMLPAPNGLVLQEYQIFRTGDFPILDQTAEAQRGCWQECIVRN